MTDRAEIERLLNQTGRTLKGLPCGYNPYKIGEVEKEYRFADRSVDTYSMANRIIHQSDVIELLVGALRDALDRPMQKPLTLEEVNKYDEPVWIEFKVFSSANGWREGISDVLYWVQRVYKDMSNPVMGVVYRLWRCKPTDEERSAAPWEN